MPFIQCEQSFDQQQKAVQRDVSIEWLDEGFIYASFSFPRTQQDHITLGDEFIIQQNDFNEIGTLVEVYLTQKVMVKLRNLKFVP